MTKATFTIVGLGRVGSSIGLALNKPELDYRVIGHDKDSAVAKQARAMGAVDSIVWNLLNACEPADVVVLAIPLDQVKQTLQAIGPNLLPGCVVIDTFPLKRPVLEWAADYMREDTHFVGISLGVNPEAMWDMTAGPEGARGDLFANSTCGLMPAADCRPQAVKTAQDLAALLGATPHFLDPAEYDGLSTVANFMPGLVTAALLGPAIDSPGWREMRRLASGELVRFSRPVMGGGSLLAQAAALNKTNVLRWLEAVIQELETLREWVEEDHRDALVARLDAIADNLDEWLADWDLNRWEKSPQTEIPTGGGMLGQLLGFGGRRKSDRDR